MLILVGNLQMKTEKMRLFLGIFRLCVKPYKEYRDHRIDVNHVFHPLAHKKLNCFPLIYWIYYSVLFSDNNLRNPCQIPFWNIFNHAFGVKTPVFNLDISCRENGIGWCWNVLIRIREWNFLIKLFIALIKLFIAPCTSLVRPSLWNCFWSGSGWGSLEVRYPGCVNP